MAGVFLGIDRLPGDLHAVAAPLARAPLVAAREADAHHHGRCCSSPAPRAFLVLEYNNPKTFGELDAWRHDVPGVLPVGDDPLGRLLGHRHRRAATARSLVVGSMLMFVGGGSASTAGGIKVTTLAVLALAVIVRGARAASRSRRSAAASRATCSASRSSVVAWGATIVRAVDDHDRADHQGARRRRAVRRHLGVRDRAACRPGSPRSCPTRRSTSWR